MTERPQATAHGDPALALPDLRAAVQRAQCRRAESDLPAQRRHAFAAFCRLRYWLTLRDLSEIMALCEIEISHETVLH